MAIDITLRSVKGSPLTSAEIDANFTNIKAYTEALVTQISAKVNEDGSLKDGSVATTDKLADNIVTLAKLATVDASNEGKVIRVKADGTFELGSLPVTSSAADSTQISSSGTQVALNVGSVAFAGVPAGDIMVTASIWARKVSGANGGTITLKAGTTDIADGNTHVLDNVTAGWSCIPLHGVISGFAGGTLTLNFVFETDESTSEIVFGQAGEGRFGRRVTILAGL